MAKHATTTTAPNGRARRDAKRAARTTAPVTATADTTTAVVPASTATAVATATAGPRALTFADYGVDAPAVIPAHVPAFASAFRAIAPMPVKTFADRIAARDAFIAATRAAGVPGIDGSAKHTGRFSSAPVFVAQNDMYVAMAFANVAIDSGHVMAAWAAEFPNATCGRTVDGCNGVPYIGRDYAWSTLSEYLSGTRHGRSSVDNGLAIVTAWAKRGRKPVDPTATA